MSPNCCKSCGVSIPEGQDFCSMCYGDPAYGEDGLYEDYLTYLAEQSLASVREWEEVDYIWDDDEEEEFDDYTD